MPTKQKRKKSDTAGGKPKPRVGRKKELIVFDFDGQMVFNVVKTSRFWIQFEDYIVLRTPELEEVWKKDSELWGLIQKAKSPGQGKESKFRTKGCHYAAKDFRTGVIHQLESILVLPGGDLSCSWYTFPREQINVIEVGNEEEDHDRNENEEEDPEEIEGDDGNEGDNDEANEAEIDNNFQEERDADNEHEADNEVNDGEGDEEEEDHEARMRRFHLDRFLDQAQAAVVRPANQDDPERVQVADYEVIVID